MYQLIYNFSQDTGNDPVTTILGKIRLQGLCARWNQENAERSGKRLQIQDVDSVHIAYFEFESEEQATIWKLTYL